MSAKFKQFREAEKAPCPQEVFIVIGDGTIVWAVTATREVAKQFIEREFGDEDPGLERIVPARVYTKLAEMPTTNDEGYLTAVHGL